MVPPPSSPSTLTQPTGRKEFSLLQNLRETLSSLGKWCKFQWNTVTQQVFSTTPTSHTKTVPRSKRWRASTKFRTKLGIGTVVATAVGSRWLSPAVLVRTLQTWIATRGFTGLASMGRTVAYTWALLVAYPHLLDKRAAEQERQRREQRRDRQRKQLESLATALERLRLEYTTITREIRSFQREILTLKVSSGQSSLPGDVQQAVDTEMAHLVQLRADVYAALQMTRQKWAERRAQSPPELWEDMVDPTLHLPVFESAVP